MKTDDPVILWLSQGDPAVRWQVKRDLLGTSDYELDRQRMVVDGWGRQLLSYQDPNGMWDGGFYTPKWTSTHYTLLLLKRLGLPRDNAQARKGCHIYLDNGFMPNGGISFWKSYPQGETCITGMALGILAYFGCDDERIDKMFHHLASQQMPDGGWNCQYPEKASHASFHTTLSVLEGLYEYSKRRPDAIKTLQAMRDRAHEFLLQHRLYQSHRTGATVDVKMTRLSYPPRWRYYVHTALDYFQKIATRYDSRLEDAIHLLQSKQKDGKWPLNQYHGGKMWFRLEKVGEPSRMNTLIALRILKWWELCRSHSY